MNLQADEGFPATDTALVCEAMKHFKVVSMAGDLSTSSMLDTFEHLKDVLESTVAIAFLGAPHAGSAEADWTASFFDASLKFAAEDKCQDRAGA
ncbi:hypothetical protein MMC22_007950 [Lobaria immixta]|nr:hypothetical protein [Lobaria immixta]